MALTEARRKDSEVASALSDFESLFHDNADAVFAYARRRSDTETAEEVVAETFAVAWRRRRDVPEPALAWLLGIARGALANSRRSAARQQALVLRLVERPPAVPEDPTGEVDVGLSARRALQLLSPAEREAMELLAWEGLSRAEAAQVVGCSRRVFAVRIHRARRRLRRYMSEDLDPMEPGSDRPIATPSAASPDTGPTTNAREAR